MKRARVTLVRGLAGKTERVKRTAQSLGLKKRGASKTLVVDKSVLGKLRVLQDFIDIEIL